MMYLLDTHVIIWCAERREDKLSPKAKEIILDAANSIYISTASLWEVAIKIGLGKITVSFERLLNEVENAGFQILHPENKYLKKLFDLPQIHKDPFDRLIIATAISEEMTLLTADDNIQKYDVQWAW